MALLNTLTSAVSALDSFTSGLNTVGNDIANVDTTAYKSADTSFADTFNGVGVQVSGVTTNFGQGALSETGNPENLGISGNGYFIVQDPATGDQYATRDGQFTVNSSGFLVNEEGYEVMGLTGGTASAAPATLGPIKLGTPPTGTQLQSVTIGTSGNLIESYSNGAQITTNQILMQNFTDQSQLVSNGDNLYTNLTAAGPISTTLSAADNTPGSAGLGSIESGTLEQSNVDLTQEFSNMITLQRAFEANARVLTTSDTILQDIVDLKQQ
jgi:flagellar hook protein FlgE